MHPWIGYREVKNRTGHVGCNTITGESKLDDYGIRALYHDSIRLFGFLQTRHKRLTFLHPILLSCDSGGNKLNSSTFGGPGPKSSKNIALRVMLSTVSIRLSEPAGHPVPSPFFIPSLHHRPELLLLR